MFCSSLFWNKKESGNVLFLILIAVMLFGALSYAVVQSDRGAQDIEKETAKTEVGKIYTAASNISQLFMRKYLVRDPAYKTMSIGVSISTVGSSCTSNTYGYCIFLESNPEYVPRYIMVEGIQYEWMGITPNKNRDIANAGNMIAYLFDVSDTVCAAYNEYVDIPGVPVNSSNWPASGGNDSTSMYGTNTACFKRPDGVNILYVGLGWY